MEITGRVQDCGCIALVPEIQEQTGLYPGATFRIEITPDKRVLLSPLEPRSISTPKPGTSCS
jgi:hypothetical protein